MNILLLGSGGREHALAWALARELDPERDNLLVAPGNAGTLAVAENIQLDATDGRQ
ncbi:MAG: phosphoribosylamine--glycine ligase, partial [Cyanobacteria bacterium NC_groundwater_1444_Ag_S-0.65um_54_12]|nr:phosphoribosylamine--glycine ligase [Cyanobacteria bacterium NC_groundwater_1444_Ag_S-0.65um_54_12]